MGGRHNAGPPRLRMGDDGAPARRRPGRAAGDARLPQRGADRRRRVERPQRAATGPHGDHRLPQRRPVHGARGALEPARRRLPGAHLGHHQPARAGRAPAVGRDADADQRARLLPQRRVPHSRRQLAAGWRVVVPLQRDATHGDARRLPGSHLRRGARLPVRALVHQRHLLELRRDLRRRGDLPRLAATVALGPPRPHRRRRPPVSARRPAHLRLRPESHRRRDLRCLRPHPPGVARCAQHRRSGRLFPRDLGRRRRPAVHRVPLQQRRQRVPRRRCHRPVRPALRYRPAAARRRVDVHPVPGRVRLHGRPQGRHAHLPVGAAPRRRQRRAPEPTRPGRHRHQPVPAAARQSAGDRRRRRGRRHGRLGAPGSAGYARAVGRLPHPAQRSHRLSAARADLAAHPRDAGELHHRQRPDVHRPPARRRGAARSHHLLLRRRADVPAGRGAVAQHDLRGRAAGGRHQGRRRQRHHRVLLHLLDRRVGERQCTAGDLGVHRLGLSRRAGYAADVDGLRDRSEQRRARVPLRPRRRDAEDRLGHGAHARRQLRGARPLPRHRAGARHGRRRRQRNSLGHRHRRAAGAGPSIPTPTRW